MDANHFDRLSRFIGATTSRRAALAALVGAGLSGLDGTVRAKGKDRGKTPGKGKHHGERRSGVGAEATCATPGHGQNLSGCNFNNTDLVNANLSSSTMKGTTFRGANLCGANLRSSQLKDADFRGFADPNRATILFKTDLSSSACNGTQFNSRSLFCGTKLCNGTISNRDCPGGVDSADLCCDCDGPNQFCDHGTCRSCDVCASGCAFSSVRTAVAAAASGDTISICPGTYSGNIINIGTNLTLVGAGSGAGGTVLDGSAVTGSNSGYILVQPQSIVTLRDLRISGRTNTGSGGGISVIAGGQVTLTRVRVSGNQARDGGGVYNQGILTLEAGTVITGNTATDSGGGVSNVGTVIPKPDSDVSGNTPDNCIDVSGGTGCS
ncbi:MAG: pentapeptide repeat-containing protein [Thermomicrobiales bacterium]